MKTIHQPGFMNGLASLLVIGIFVSGCASEPESRGASESAATASNVAVSMVGKPYRYGGRTPKGFDCSGLVYYSFRHAGMEVPRSTESLRTTSRKVSLSRIGRGDLLFFNQEGKYSSHVGIYLGDGRFVHAPSSGKRVRIDRLSDPYWKNHLVDARRL